MNTKQLKIVLAALAERIEELQKEIRINEYTIGNLQRKVKIYEESKRDV